MEVIKIISIPLAIFSALFLMYYAFKKNLLRESYRENSPYSFSKFQLWLWTLTIIPLFILNWGYISPTEPGLNLTCLILLGISLTSTLTALVITDIHDARITLKGNTVPEIEKLNLLKNKNKAKLEGKIIKKYNDSVSFFHDILTDDSGQFSIARLQQFLFTLAFVVIFVSSFFLNDMKYIDFDETAFVVMGISTGGYLTAKSQYK